MNARRPLALLLALLLACTAGAREKTLRTTLATADVARQTFLAFDDAHQHELVAKAPDRAAGDKALADYYRARQTVVTAFALLYRSIAAAAVVNDQPSIDGMLQAAVILGASLKDLGVKL